MAFALILPASRPLLAADPVAPATPAEADRAAAALRGDYERWSRWAVGLGAFAAAVGGTFLAGGLIATMVVIGVGTATDIAVVAIAGALAIAGGAVLAALWRSGRALTRAAALWLRVPYDTGRRAPRAAGWVQARTVNIEPRILVRLITATLALLVAIGGVSLFVRDLGAGFSVLTVPVLLVGVCAALSGCGQIGGVMRIVDGMSARDPLWSRLVGATRGRSSRS